MTEESLDAGQILTRCAALPGIQAAILMNGSTTRSALDGAGNEEAHTFASTAPQTYSSITTLAESMGMPQHGNFTIRSNKSVRSFFVEKGICLAVLHEQAVFQPGVRERLILIARALSSMES